MDRLGGSGRRRAHRRADQESARSISSAAGAPVVEGDDVAAPPLPIPNSARTVRASGPRLPRAAPRRAAPRAPPLSAPLAVATISPTHLPACRRPQSQLELPADLERRPTLDLDLEAWDDGEVGQADRRDGGIDNL